MMTYVALPAATFVYFTVCLVAGQLATQIPFVVAVFAIVIGGILVSHWSTNRYRRSRWRLYEKGRLLDAVVLAKDVPVFPAYRGHAYVRAGYFDRDSQVHPLDAQPIPFELNNRWNKGARLQIIALPESTKSWIPVVDCRT